MIIIFPKLLYLSDSFLPSIDIATSYTRMATFYHKNYIHYNFSILVSIRDYFFRGCFIAKDILVWKFIYNHIIFNIYYDYCNYFVLNFFHFQKHQQLYLLRHLFILLENRWIIFITILKPNFIKISQLIIHLRNSVLVLSNIRRIGFLYFPFK